MANIKTIYHHSVHQYTVVLHCAYHTVQDQKKTNTENQSNNTIVTQTKINRPIFISRRWL